MFVESSFFSVTIPWNRCKQDQSISLYQGHSYLRLGNLSCDQNSSPILTIEFMIRKARSEDSESLAELMLLAMSDIVFAFIGSYDKEQALTFITKLVQQRGNQYSFENTWLAEENRQILGSITSYDGADLKRLRQPVLDLLSEHYGRNISPEIETEAGETYIDTLAVHPDHRGKGLGIRLLQFIIEHKVKQEGETLGLLVDKNNLMAKKLYLKLGFRKVGERQLVNHPYDHMQLKPKA